jgi:hypothetical protein
MWRGLETGERRAFSESFHPFRAERIYPAKKRLFNLITKKKDNANPIDTSIVVPIRGVA